MARKGRVCVVSVAVSRCAGGRMVMSGFSKSLVSLWLEDSDMVMGPGVVKVLRR